MGKCLDVETIAAYLEHKLPPAMVAKIESHLVECRSCRRIIANVIKSEMVVPDPPIPNKKLKPKKYSEE